MRRATIVVPALAIALALNACATKKAAMPSFSEAQRARLGRVGIVVVEIAPKAAADGPTPLGGFGGGVKGAAQGLAIGVVGTVVSGACVFTGGRGAGEVCLTALGLAVMTPYWVGRGTVEGAMKAMPEGERRAHRAAIITAIGGVDTQRIASAIDEERRRRAVPATVTLLGPAPAGAGGGATYRDTASRGIDTVAEITLLRLGLERRPSGSPLGASSQSVWKVSVPDVDPMLALVAEARLRLVSATDDTVLFETTYLHRSSRDAKFVEWGRDAATEFLSARDEAMDALGRNVATELFGVERATEPATEPAAEER